MSAFFLKHPRETDLALFAGGESGPFARWRIERHVERCSSCRAEAGDYFRLSEELEPLADLPEVDWSRLGASIEAGVRADRAAGSPEGFRSSPRLWLGAGVVAAAAAAAFVTLRTPVQIVEPEPQIIARVAEPRYAPLTPVEEAVVVEPMERREVDVAASTESLEPKTQVVTDVAAPAPPPPPVLKSVAASQAPVANGAPVALAAESSSARLRDDAAARVGAVSAIPAGGLVEDSAGWVRYPVVAENAEGAPVQLISGYAEAAGEAIRTPAMALANRSDRAITAFTLVWILEGDGVAHRTLVSRSEVSVAPGSTTLTTDGVMWQLRDGAPGAMRAYPLTVSFEDGSTWTSPRSAGAIGAESLQRFVPITGR